MCTCSLDETIHLFEEQIVLSIPAFSAIRLSFVTRSERKRRCR